MGNFSKNTKWIRNPGMWLGNWEAKVSPAPFFRRVFNWDKTGGARVLICGLGYYELYMNGRKVGDRVLDPVVTQYDKRVRYAVYDVTEWLSPGKNVAGVILGNGWYNCHTPEVWHFDKAPWRDVPKLLFQLEADGEPVLISDESWKSSFGPIVFDGLRNGETYDARLELDGWLSPDYDDSAWKNCVRISPPGGALEEQLMPPCKVMETIPPVKKWLSGGAEIYDFGQNISGWCRLRVSGERGASLRVTYGERIKPDGTVDQAHIAKHVRVKAGEFQTDRYTLRGGGEEIWEPRFTYHGFQFAQIDIEGEARILDAAARFVCSSFERAGNFSCSDNTLNRLQDCAVRSYKSNFTGIPTDCPHREKNGWTGDAHLASETGLFNFKAASAYSQWMDSVADAQLPSGQLPGIIPCCGWGYSGAGAGPAWDSALFIIPWNIYLFTGDASVIEKHYDAMARYIDYCFSMADNNILSFGLGDWCHPDMWQNCDQIRVADPSITSTAYYYTDCALMAKFAALAGRGDDRLSYAALASRVKDAFNKRFHKGDGLYARGQLTALACALWHGLTEDSWRAKTAKCLAKAVEAEGCKAVFGILGAKYVPRALAENGYADLALKVITQPEFPGWGNWIKRGATTLWESWSGESSLNHIMFGDISAWMFQYIAGIAADPENPGFKRVIIHPRPAGGIDSASAWHDSPFGRVSSSWRMEKGLLLLDIQIPEPVTALVTLPGSSAQSLAGGAHKLTAVMD
jgi:alpha-L-rhamnosidase